MLACCETGYCEAYERDAAWQDEGYGDREADRESLPYVTEDDLPIGEEERDYVDVDVFLASYVGGYPY